MATLAKADSEDTLYNSRDIDSDSSGMALHCIDWHESIVLP